MRIFVITKRTLIIWILILALVITGIILLLSFTPNAAAVSSSAMVEAYEMEVLAGRHKEVPVYSVDRADKKIALTIDAAWEDDKTPFILDTLAQYNVKATFFLCGFWVEKYPDEVKQIAAAGHEIGNHTATHPHMNQLDAKGIEKELADFEAMTTKLIGKKTALFRPPYGEYNDTVITTARGLGYEVIQWDIDTSSGILIPSTGRRSAAPKPYWIRCCQSCIQAASSCATTTATRSRSTCPPFWRPPRPRGMNSSR